MLVVAGLLGNLPRTCVQHADVPASHRSWILQSVREWVEDFPDLNGIRADVDAYVCPPEPTHLHTKLQFLRSKLPAHGEISEGEFKSATLEPKEVSQVEHSFRAAHQAWKERTISDLEVYSREGMDASNGDPLSSIIPDSMLLSLAVELSTRFEPKPPWWYDARILKPLDMMFRRTQCLSYNVRTKELLQMMFGLGLSEWAQEYEAMRQHANKTMWEKILMMCRELRFNPSL